MQRQRINLPIAFILIWLGLSLVIFQPGKAIAHALNMQYETTSAIKLHVDDGGVVLTDAQVNVFAPDNLGEPWLRGKTDSKGDFLFIPDPAIPGDWQIQVRQAGHAGEVTIAIASTAESIANQATNIAPESEPNRAEDVVNDEIANPAVDPAIAADDLAAEAIVTSNISTTAGGTATYSAMQKTVMITSVLWGCLGTALFFWRRK
jgi:nickel transport protein